MKLFLIIFISIIIFLLLLTVIIGLIGYKLIYQRNKKPYDLLTNDAGPFSFPPETKKKCAEFRNMLHEEIYITNKRGIKLYGELRKTEHKFNDVPTVILFAHGHKSAGNNDIAIFYNFPLKNYDLLTIDHEGGGKSGGKHSGFGIYEQEDIRLWVEELNRIYNHKVNIFLHGVSMGCNSVLLTADKTMENVKGIIADCGFISTYRIVRHMVKLNTLAFMVCLFNSLVIKRNIFKYSTLKVLKHSLYPILFIHGKADNYVPTYMSIMNNKVCTSKHKLVLVDNANHAMSYITNPVLYETEYNSFIKNTLQGSDTL